MFCLFLYPQCMRAGNEAFYSTLCLIGQHCMLSRRDLSNFSGHLARCLMIIKRPAGGQGRSAQNRSEWVWPAALSTNLPVSTPIGIRGGADSVSVQHPLLWPAIEDLLERTFSLDIRMVHPPLPKPPQRPSLSSPNAPHTVNPTSLHSLHCPLCKCLSSPPV